MPFASFTDRHSGDHPGRGHRVPEMGNVFAKLGPPCDVFKILVVLSVPVSRASVSLITMSRLLRVQSGCYPPLQNRDFEVQRVG